MADQSRRHRLPTPDDSQETIAEYEGQTLSRYFGINQRAALQAFSRRAKQLGDRGYLHHYTDSAGLIGILTPQRYACVSPSPWMGDGHKAPCVWATNARFMNDTSELRYSINLVKPMLQTFLDDNAWANDCPNPGAARSKIGSVLATVTNSHDSSSVFVASFSQSANDLSQWRGYSNGMGGFSVGLTKGHLQTLAARQGFILLPCIYDERVQAKLLREAVTHVVEAIRASSRPAGEDDSTGEFLVRLLSTRLQVICAVFKSKHFQGEKEWRAIFAPEPFLKRPGFQPPLSYRAAPLGIAPYVQFRLIENPEDKLTGLRIYVGPSHESSASKVAVEQFIQSVGATGSVIESGIPFRPTR